MKLKLFLVSVIFSGLAFGIAFENIDATTEAKMNEAIKILQNNATSTEVKSQKMFDIFDEFFDFEQMAKNCLGKAQWDTLDDSQKNLFLDKFVKRLKESYTDKMKLYTDQKIELEKSVQTSPTRVHLPMILIGSDGKKYDIVYKFWNTKKQSGWLIYDVDILGVSITQTYRSQLDGALKNGSFETLIKKIETVQLDEQK